MKTHWPNCNKDTRIKDFVSMVSKSKLKKTITVHDFRLLNHEIWKLCSCGEIWDARVDGLSCPKCGIELYVNRNKNG